MIDDARNIPTKRDYANIFFDLDGTLTDSKTGIIRSIEYALNAMQTVAAPDDDLSWCLGPPLRESFRKLLPAADPADIEEALGFFRDRYAAEGLFENTLYPGIEAMLGTLKQAGCHLFVVSETDPKFIRKILAHLGIASSFMDAYGPQPDGTRDSKIDLLRFVLCQQKIDAPSALMVGDRKYDILAAAHNEVDALGATYGYGSSAELLVAGADALCSSPAAVSKWIVGHAGSA